MESAADDRADPPHDGSDPAPASGATDRRVDPAAPPSPPQGWRHRLRTWLPPLGTAVLLGYLAWTTDLARAADAFARADLGLLVSVLVFGTLITWVADSACVAWLIGLTLGHRGEGRPLGLRDVLPIKAASYVLNILNYHAAAVGMAWVVARRKRVGMVESVAALAVLSYMDIVALATLVFGGLWLAPEVMAELPELQQRLKLVGGAIFAVALIVLLLLQSPLRQRHLQRLRELPLLRPVAAIAPLRMMQGVLVRTAFISLYVLTNYAMMHAFGMRPELGLLMVYVPILSVVGALPLSVSGLGTTQILMRTFYVSLVAPGQQTDPVIDAYSTVMILGFVAVRLVVAAPFLPAILRELRGRADSDGRSQGADLAEG